MTGNTPLLLRLPPELLAAVDKKTDGLRTRQAVIIEALARQLRVAAKPPRRGYAGKRKSD